MTIPGLSLAAIPAVSSLAGQAVRSSAQAGQKFLQLLAQPPSPADAAPQPERSPSSTSASLDEPTTNWSQRFMSWLRQQGVLPNNQDFSLQLSLDQRDQPRVLLDGQPATAVEQALSSDPTWMQEFRELALDRWDGLPGLAWSNQAGATLTIQPQSDTMVPSAKWN